MLIYNLLLRAYSLLILIVSPFNPKAKKWIEGRKNWRKRLNDLIGDHKEIVWVHAASLGEAEQGLPIISRLKQSFPEKKILLTFFSPSGFENFKPSKWVDFTFYLPLDTKKNAKDFLSIAEPEMALFIKYEIWAHYFSALIKNKTHLVLAPALFRSTQIYFKKPISGFFLKVLRKLDHIFVQNQDSWELLKRHGLENSSVCGETRLDRVLDLVNEEYKDEFINDFCSNKKTLIAGSSWQFEEKILQASVDKLPEHKLIIAPHDISASHINKIVKLFGEKMVCLYSEKPANASKFDILIIDNIGLLSRLYRYADIAFIGGGFGAGLHSTVEAAAYGMPVIFGPNHSSFIEPKEMIASEFGFEVSNQKEFQEITQQLLSDETLRQKTSEKAKVYIKSKSGASEIISDFLIKLISQN